MKSIYKEDVSSINGEKNFLSQFEGKVTLIVNIASKLGYTPQCSMVWSYLRTCRQLWQLQYVHDEFKDRGFSVVGFPCNQFGQMEPMENESISKFIKENYSFVTFPIGEKIEVNGVNEHPIYSMLKGLEKRSYSDTAADQSDSAKLGQNLAGQAVARIPHNYEKFLVSREGQMIARFNWQDMPLDTVPRIQGAGWTIREAISEVLG
jgi:glutathione peroxidase